MMTIVNLKGQITIPKRIRDALGLKPGKPVELMINKDGQLVILKVPGTPTEIRDRFEAVRGKEDIKWQTHELMALLRGDT